MTSPRRLSRSLFDRILNANANVANDNDRKRTVDAGISSVVPRSPLASIDHQALLSNTQAMPGPTLTSHPSPIHKEHHGKPANFIGNPIVNRRSSYNSTDEDAFPSGSSQSSVHRKRSQ